MGCAAANACRETPLVHAPQGDRRVVSRVYAATLPTARARILDRFATSRGAFPEPFNHMTASELTAPRFPPDWLVTSIDPGGFLVAYKQLYPADRQHDVLIQEPTGDLYWPSVYATAEGPVQFRCGFILHFVDRPAAGTEIQIYEVVPTVWVGEHWAMSAHGVGFGRYHDIRFVEPTTKDRNDLFDLLDHILAG
jgi:hypothetical protein